MQKQVILTVRLVVKKEDDLDSAEQLLTEVLTDAELMAHVKAERIEYVKAAGVFND